jgi:hypothetical protein
MDSAVAEHPLYTSKLIAAAASIMAEPQAGLRKRKKQLHKNPTDGTNSNVRVYPFQRGFVAHFVTSFQKRVLREQALE